MRTRAWALWIVFGLLGFVALGAIIGAVSRSWDIIGRVIATGVIGAVAGSLAIPLTGLVDRPRLRIGALGALCSLGLVVVLLTLGIWLMERGGSEVGERLMLLAGSSAVCLLPIVAALFAMPFVSSRWLPIAIIMLSSAAWIMGWPAIILEERATAREWYLLGVVLGGASLSLLGLLARSERERAWPGVVLSAVPVLAVIASAMVILHGNVWMAWPRHFLNWPEGTLAMFWIGSLGVTLWWCSRLLDLRGIQRHLRSGLLASCLGPALIFGLTAETGRLGALGAALLVVAVCHIVAMAIVVRMNRRAELSMQLAEVHPGAIPCPRCRDTIELRPGYGTCHACGLAYRLEIQPARCRRCGHDVTHSPSLICTECGEPIRLAPADARGGSPSLTPQS